MVCVAVSCTFVVYDAFEHWKKLVNLLCSSEDALLTHTELFSSFICKLNLCITLFVELTCIFLHIFIRVAVLHFQLKEVPDDFFVDIVSRNNFLTVTLQVIRTTRVHVYIIPREN